MISNATGTTMPMIRVVLLPPVLVLAASSGVVAGGYGSEGGG